MIVDRRGGFTLVEVLLTLALAVVLVVMVGSALTFYANNLQTKDSDVRRAQLASALLQMISSDLKATLHPPKFDDSALAKVLSGAGGGSGAASGSSSAGGDASASESGLSDLPEEEESEEPFVDVSDLSMNGMTLQRPGLIGNQFQIQFDVSRLPRLEEYQQLLTTPVEGMSDVPSDIKTLTYYVQAAGGSGVVDPLSQVADPDADPLAFGGGSTGGLVRRQLDRQVTKFAFESGGLASMNLSGDLLAPEVVALEFSYFDGFQWRMEWNSDTYGGLPLAVQVQLTLSEPGIALDSVNVADSDQVRTFRQIIRLPMGRPLEEDESTVTSDPLSAAGI